MTNRADFIIGGCYCCLEEKILVRQHDNIYMRGSEGTTLCELCELKMRVFLEALHSVAIQAEMRGRKEQKRLQQS